MPITWSETTTPGGQPILRSLTSGRVEQQDLVALLREIEVARKPLLSVIKAGSEFTPEARAVLKDMKMGGEGGFPVAVVMESAMLRVVVGFMLKFASKTTAGSTPIKTFDTEAEGAAWLDEMKARPES